MKVFSVYGFTDTGKTTVVETLIHHLKKKRYTVGSIKEIHYERFKIDTPGSNTERHRIQGADPVTARGYSETDVMYGQKLSLLEILAHYHQDFVVCEGVTDYNLPKILTAKTMEELEERWEFGVFAISGRIASQLGSTYRGVPVINVLTHPELLCDLVLEKVFELLPDVDTACCNACGYGCRGLTDQILKGKASRDDCIQQNRRVDLIINGQAIPMVPFVETILRNTCLGVVKSLDGYRPNTTIEIKLNERIT